MRRVVRGIRKWLDSAPLWFPNARSAAPSALDRERWSLAFRPVVPGVSQTRTAGRLSARSHCPALLRTAPLLRTPGHLRHGAAFGGMSAGPMSDPVRILPCTQETS